jgi:hypothetical protein
MGRRWFLVVLVLLAGCGGDDGKAVREDPKTVGTTTAEKPEKPLPKSTGATTTPPRESTTQRTTPPEVLTSGPRREVARQVGELIQAVELGDGPSFCRALGRDPGGAQGVEALRACGRQAGIDPFRLPTSDEFSVTSVRVEGSRATAKLGGGQTVVLRRAGKRWQIVSFRP